MELDIYEVFVEEYQVVEVNYGSGFKADLFNLQSIKDLSGDFCIKKNVSIALRCIFISLSLSLIRPPSNA